MPAQANLTVKKNDGSTDITYTAVQASGGDKSPAIWRSNTVGTAPGHRPELRVSAQPNGPGTARRVNFQFTYPVTATGSDGKVYVSNRCNLEITGVMPLDMPDSDLNEAVSQGLNLAAATLTKDQFKSGFAAT